MKKVACELSAQYNINPVQTDMGEYAWGYSDYPAILTFIQKNEFILLGGDILTMDLKYTYDNWYYNPDLTKSHFENVWQSLAVAEEYLNRYHQLNGAEFYIVFVLRRSSL